MNINDLEIVRNGNISPHDVSNLRKEVGWDPCFEKMNLIIKNSYTYFSITENNNLIAFARVISDGYAISLIVDLNIHPKYQKQGIGTKFVKYIIEELKKDKIKYIQLIFDTELRTFYEKCGFEIGLSGSILNKSTD